MRSDPKPFIGVVPRVEKAKIITPGESTEPTKVFEQIAQVFGGRRAAHHAWPKPDHQHAKSLLVTGSCRNMTRARICGRPETDTAVDFGQPHFQRLHQKRPAAVIRD